MSRYSNVDYVLNLSIDDFINLYQKAIEKEIEKRTWEYWIHMYPYMEKKISYEELLNISKQQEVKENIPVNGLYVDQVFF